MAPIEVLFGIMVAIFTLIGYARGFLRELGVTAVMVWTLFVLSLIGPLLERILGGDPLTANRAAVFSAGYLVIIIVAALVSYHGETLAFAGVSPQGVTGAVLNLLIGLVNGYLISGSLWYYMARFNYPIRFLGITSQGLSSVAQALQPYLPPALLGQPVLLGQNMLLYLSVLLIMAKVIR
ncbi:MAG: hypothetical protein GXY52_00810 [Chloroflexi bacterium]|nr:hypothetical protein [Chloroflexota bacterium]